MANAEILERLITARINFLIDYPFWGNLAIRLKLEEDESVPTAATDGRKVYYNPKFMSDLKKKQIIFVFGHELLHVVYDHLGRTNEEMKLNHHIANVAADFVVNRTLIQEKIGDPCGEFISRQDILNEVKKVGVFYDSYYDGFSFEDVFEDLKQIAIKKGNISYVSGFDHHLNTSDEGDGNGGRDENGRPTIPSSELAKIRDEIREAVLSAAQVVGIGNVPGDIRRIIGNLTEPKMNWRQLLTQFVESQVTSDQTYMRLGRRSFSSSFIFPSRQKEPCVEVALALDMSGSIGDVEIRDFFSEVYGIVSQYDSYRITVCCWDTKVYNYQEFSSDDLSSDIMDYQPSGGGGTDLSCVFEYMKTEGIIPKQLVVFTDGEISNWGDSEYCETLFIIKNQRDITAPFGTTVEYS